MDQQDHQKRLEWAHHLLSESISNHHPVFWDSGSNLTILDRIDFLTRDLNSIIGSLGRLEKDILLYSVPPSDDHEGDPEKDTSSDPDGDLGSEGDPENEGTSSES